MEAVCPDIHCCRHASSPLQTTLKNHIQVTAVTCLHGWQLSCRQATALLQRNTACQSKPRILQTPTPGQHKCLDQFSCGDTSYAGQENHPGANTLAAISPLQEANSCSASTLTWPCATNRRRERMATCSHIGERKRQHRRKHLHTNKRCKAVSCNTLAVIAAGAQLSPRAAMVCGKATPLLNFHLTMQQQGEGTGCLHSCRQAAPAALGTGVGWLQCSKAADSRQPNHPGQLPHGANAVASAQLARSTGCSMKQPTAGEPQKLAGRTACCASTHRQWGAHPITDTMCRRQWPKQRAAHSGG